MSFPPSRPIVRHSRSFLLRSLRFRDRTFTTTPLSPFALRHPTPSSTTATGGTPFLPRLLRPSQLKSIFPSFSRSTPRSSTKKNTEGWNPYTFFIAAFLILGSQAINLIALKHEHRDFMWRSEARIGLLREVIERIERGEDVDVGKMLGAGVEAEEKGWEEVLKEIEEEDLRWHAKRQKKQGKAGEEHAPEQEPAEEEAARDKYALLDRPLPVKKKASADDSTFL